MQLSLFTVVPMILVLASASAESHLRGLQAQDRPILDDFWNDSQQSCNACGGFWPTTQPANCQDEYNQDLTQCSTVSPTSAPTASTTSNPTSNPTSEPQPKSSSPTSNPTTFPIGSGCCSQNFRTCATNGADSKESCELLGSMIWLENGDLPQQCLEQDSACTDNLNGCCPGLTCDGDQWYKQCKFLPNATKSPTSAPTITCNEDIIDSLQAAIESLEESIVDKDSIIADLTLQLFPVNCVNGYEVGTGFTCEKACDGKCCNGPEACDRFTGHIHRDGSCEGIAACRDATINEVRESCKGMGACTEGKFVRVTDSCNGRTLCYGSEITSIERSCNVPTEHRDDDCSSRIATSIVDGKRTEMP